MRKCSGCQIEYNKSEFYNEDYLCKECRKEYNKQYNKRSKQFEHIGKLLKEVDRELFEELLERI